LSSTSTSYIRRVDQPTYISNNSSVPLNAYTQSVNGSTLPHLTYFQTNPNPLAYSYHNQQTLLNPSYSIFCCGIPYPPNSTYLPSDDSKNNENIYSDNENLLSNKDENNDSGIKSETSSNEQKSTPPSSNDSNTNFQEDKNRDLNSNLRPRWKIGDICLARWSEDGEFYYADIVDIQPPYCTVLFRGYDTYDQVLFSDLEIIPRDQQFYPFILPSTDLNMLTANAYFPPRTNFYPPTIDGCIIMPEAPPFPFNSAGTLYMYPETSITPTSQSNDDQQDTQTNENDDQQDMQTNENDDLITNSSSSSSPTKDLNEDSSLPKPCSIADAPLTLVTSDDLHEQKSNEDHFLPKPCSIADAPLTLVTSDDLHEQKSNEDHFLPKPCSIADAPLTLVTSDDLDKHKLNDDQQIINKKKK